MDRREFLRAGAWGALAGAAVAPGLICRRVSAQARARPNILFCIADDLSGAHTGASGDRVVQTPAFDRVAREGVLFSHCYCAAPSCTPSRGSILTGQMFWRLEEGGNLWSTLPAKFQVYPELLEAAGYHVGLQGKGWGPGDFKPGGRTRNPAGPNYKSFGDFFKSVPPGRPFCFWYGSNDPHRPYEKGSGLASGKKLEEVRVPPFLPDSPEVRSDLLDYYFEVERFDRNVGEMVRLLEEAGKLDDTIVVMTSDNGMPFPRSKANLYEYGTRMPLAVRWPQAVKGGRAIQDLVSHTDLAPTFLEAAGLAALPEMTGRTLLGLLTGDKDGWVDPKRDRAFTGRERHANCREGNVGYPCRALRTRRFLYIRNFEPDRWPAGDPERYGDIDGGPSKTFMMENREAKNVKSLFELAFEKRPAEELYDLEKDPGELRNVAAEAGYARVKARVRKELEQYLTETSDPRIKGEGGFFDACPYYGRVATREPNLV